MTRPGKTDRQEIEERVRQMNWPAPPPGLRDRVLSAALVNLPPITWSDRVWFSRGWRLSALAAALVIVAVDQFPTAPQLSRPGPAPFAVAQSQAIEDAARQGDLPAAVAASFARRALAEASRPGTTARTGPAALEEFELDTAGGTR